MVFAPDSRQILVLEQIAYNCQAAHSRGLSYRQLMVILYLHLEKEATNNELNSFFKTRCFRNSTSIPNLQKNRLITSLTLFGNGQEKFHFLTENGKILADGLLAPRRTLAALRAFSRYRLTLGQFMLLIAAAISRIKGEDGSTPQTTLDRLIPSRSSGSLQRLVEKTFIKNSGNGPEIAQRPFNTLLLSLL